MRRALAIDENSFGPQHPNVAIRLNNLALLLEASIRPTEAEPLVRRAIAIFEKSLGTDHPNVATAVGNLAFLLQATNRSADAEPLMRRAIAIFENSLGADHPNVATAVNNLAVLLPATNRLAEAEPLMRSALAIDEKSLGPDHPNVALRLNNLALLLQTTNRLAEAEPLYRQALAINEKSLGPEHPVVANSLNNLAGLFAERDDWTAAAALGRRAKPLLVGRGDADGGDRNGLAFLDSNTWAFRAHARAIYRADAENNASREEGFELAQWALQTSAAQALAQMSARFAKGAGPLALLVRKRQDLIAMRQKDDKHLLASVGTANATITNAKRTSIAALDGELKAIDRLLAAEFKEYADLSNPKPLSTAATQALLQPDEALVLYLDVPQIGRLAEETLAWVVAKGTSRWISIPLGTEALGKHVLAVRCGLDRTAWDGEGRSRCANLLKIDRDNATKPDEPLAFDLASAHELYKALFGQIAGLIKDKHLLIVPSGPLTQLPFHVLVSEEPDPTARGADAFRRAGWLARSNSITVLPSVSSLKALREHTKTNHATKPFVGFGNPLLDGPDYRYVVRAEMARAKQQCAKAPAQRVAPVARGMKPLQQRGGIAEVADIRSKVPLPETADELCTVARDLGVSDSDIWLGARANEREIKRLSESGQLASYRIVHFATHGALAGQLKAGSEPGLILTPPGEATPEDDGYLSASEIAGLKLDADWVILSACNTAAGGVEGTEALSGMSRAFFYAGARALLVSHWAVNSDATVKLITKMLSTMAADKTVGRSEALRRSMAALIDAGDPNEAHPANWAPFVVVGEGGAATSSQAEGPVLVFLVPPAQKRMASPKSRPKGQPWTVEIWRKHAN